MADGFCKDYLTTLCEVGGVYDKSKATLTESRLKDIELNTGCNYVLFNEGPRDYRLEYIQEENELGIATPTIIRPRLFTKEDFKFDTDNESINFCNKIILLPLEMVATIIKNIPLVNPVQEEGYIVHIRETCRESNHLGILRGDKVYREGNLRYLLTLDAVEMIIDNYYPSYNEVEFIIYSGQFYTSPAGKARTFRQSTGGFLVWRDNNLLVLDYNGEEYSYHGLKDAQLRDIAHVDSTIKALQTRSEV